MSVADVGMIIQWGSSTGQIFDFEGHCLDFCQAEPLKIMPHATARVPRYKPAVRHKTACGIAPVMPHAA